MLLLLGGFLILMLLGLPVALAMAASSLLYILVTGITPAWILHQPGRVLGHPLVGHAELKEPLHRAHALCRRLVTDSPGCAELTHVDRTPLVQHQVTLGL